MYLIRLDKQRFSLYSKAAVGLMTFNKLKTGVGSFK